jgi:PEP-CTERM motif
MSNRLIVLGSSTFFALAGLATAAPAAVIDTFSFSNSSGWDRNGNSFSGSFTGSVEASGLIELSDLSAFQITGIFGFDIPFSGNSLSDLAFFNYDTGGGASSLGFIYTIPPIGILGAPLTVCSGAPSVLSLACSFGGNNPATTRAVILFSVGLAFTPDLTNVTLVPVPEPSTLAMLLIGFAGLGYAGYRRAREPHAGIKRAARKPPSCLRSTILRLKALVQAFHGTREAL